MTQTPREDFVESADHEGYRFAEIESDYGGVAQRWLVVHSDELQKKATERLQRNLDQREKELNRGLWRLCRQEFACGQDAREAAEGLCPYNFCKLMARQEEAAIFLQDTRRIVVTDIEGGMDGRHRPS